MLHSFLGKPLKRLGCTRRFSTWNAHSAVTSSGKLGLGLTFRKASLSRSSQQFSLCRNYSLYIAPRHVYPKSWETFENDLNVDYIEKDTEHMLKYLGLEHDQIPQVRKDNFSGIPLYKGDEVESDAMLVHYLADEADRLVNLDPDRLSPLDNDYLLRSLYFNTASVHFEEESYKMDPFWKPISVPLWLGSSSEEAGDVPGTDVATFKDRSDHFRPEYPVHALMAHSVRRTNLNDADKSFLKSEDVQSVGVVTLADASGLAYPIIPDTFDFGRIRSIINYAQYGFNPVMPMITCTGSLVKFSIGLFDPEYCVACTKVAQHKAPNAEAKVIGFTGSRDSNGWNLLLEDEREQIFKYIAVLRKFAAQPLDKMMTVEKAESILSKSEE